MHTCVFIEDLLCTGALRHDINTHVFVFVLMGWLLLPNALRLFQIYCAPPNLGIRT